MAEVRRCDLFSLLGRRMGSVEEGSAGRDDASRPALRKPNLCECALIRPPSPISLPPTHVHTSFLKGSDIEEKAEGVGPGNANW